MFNVATVFRPSSSNRGTLVAYVVGMSDYADQKAAAAELVAELVTTGTKSELAAALILATRQGRVDDYAALLTAWEAR